MSTNYTAPLAPSLEAVARALYVSENWSASITEPDQERKPKAHYNALAEAHWDSGFAGYSRYATYRSLAEVAVAALPSAIVEAEPYTFHCTDRNPDYCACATDEGSDCVLCGEPTDGYTTLNIIRQLNPFIPEDEVDQEWETITRHKNCDEAKEEDIDE